MQAIATSCARWKRPAFALLLALATLLGGSGLPAARLLADSRASVIVPLERFPPEERASIRRTMALIDADGPFPYHQDGSLFRNREHRLPARGTGYYREYTVPTPGAGDRGARRIVAGRQGEIYYSNDHYRSFYRLR